MTDNKRLYDGVSRAAWAYLFVYFDFNINGVSIFPSFVGFLLFLSAIKLLKEEERDLALLRPLGILLAVWHGVKWAGSWISADPEDISQFLNLIISLANLYLHFQLLTNLASIAAKYQTEGAALDKRLLKYRTMQTVMLTGIMILTSFAAWLTEVWLWISIGMLIVYLIAAVCLMNALFALRKYLS